MADDDALVEEDLDEELQELTDLDDWAQGAALWSTDWTAETILAQLHRSNIDLDPTFQRRSAWTDKRQSLFIESLILGLPIPQLILAESKTKKGSFIVIDGKQRLLAIRKFGSTQANDEFEPLRLSGLKERERLNDHTYADLIADDHFRDDRAAFDNASVRTIVIRNWKEEGYLYEVFLRINTGSVQLSPQELRQALHPGPFSAYVSRSSAESIQLKFALNLEQPDFRMRDAEILLRYLGYKNFIEGYRGNLKQFLDTTTENLNADWAARQAQVEQQVEEMERAFQLARDIFGDNYYLRKWNGTEFEPRKNRAVFDIMLHYFSVPAVRDALAGKNADVVARFKELCENNNEFRAALETTTKSLKANRARFNIWGEAVGAISGVDVSGLMFPQEHVA